MSHETKYVNWSELGNPTLPGTYRTQDLKVIQISIHLILGKDKRPGDQQVEISRNATAGENVWVAVRFMDA